MKCSRLPSPLSCFPHIILVQSVLSCGGGGDGGGGGGGGSGTRTDGERTGVGSKPAITSTITPPRTEELSQILHSVANTRSDHTSFFTKTIKAYCGGRLAGEYL